MPGDAALVHRREAANLPELHMPAPEIYATSVIPALEQAIIRGDIPGGTRLLEEEICHRMGVSRSPVREALRQLERDGLLVREPHRGVRVSELTTTELEQLYVCRMALESTAAQLAVKAATNKEIKAIRSAHLACVKALGRDAVLEHFESNVEMGSLIFASSHNEPLIRLLGTVHKQALRYRYIAYNQSRLVRENSVKANALLVQALENRDEELAGRMARASIEGSHAVIRQCLEARDQASIAA